MTAAGNRAFTCLDVDDARAHLLAGRNNLVYDLNGDKRLDEEDLALLAVEAQRRPCPLSSGSSQCAWEGQTYCDPLGRRVVCGKDDYGRLIADPQPCPKGMACVHKQRTALEYWRGAKNDRLPFSYAECQYRFRGLV